MPRHLLPSLFVIASAIGLAYAGESVPAQSLAEGLQFWGYLNAILSCGTLLYVTKTESRITQLETLVKLLVGKRDLAD